jgi:hypothetical protein
VRAWGREMNEGEEEEKKEKIRLCMGIFVNIC